jgi:hypothetical protein
MYGLGLGATQLGAEVGNKMGLVDDSTVNSLRQQGDEHRMVMDAMKSEGGREKGFGNTASWGEFTGETIPGFLIPGGAGGKLASKFLSTGMRAPVRNALIGGATGLAGGGGYGAITPLGQNQSRGQEMALDAMFGGVLGAAGAGLGTMGKQFVTDHTGPLNEKIDFYLRRAAPYPTSAPKNPAAHTRMVADRAEGVKNIYKLRDHINLPDRTGAMSQGKLPSNQFEFISSIEQGKNALFDMYNTITQRAQSKGIQVGWDDVIAKLHGIANDKGYDQAIRQKALKEITRIQRTETHLTPVEAQKRIAGMNEKLADYYTHKNMGDYDSSFIMKQVLDELRQTLNKSIEQAGPEYGQLKKSWGSINSLEKDALRSYERVLNKGVKGDKFDFIAGEQVLYAAAKGNLKYLIPAIGTKSMRLYHKLMSSEDASVRRMFKMVSRELGDARLEHPSSPAQQPQALLPHNPPPLVPIEPRQLGHNEAIPMDWKPTPTGKPPIQLKYVPKQEPGSIVKNIYIHSNGKPIQTAQDMKSLMDSLKSFGYTDQEIAKAVFEIYEAERARLK